MSLGKVTKRLYSVIIHLFLEHNLRARLKVLIFNQDENSKLLKEIFFFDVTNWSAIKRLNAWLSKN